MQNVLVQFNDVTYRAEEKPIISHINWEIKKGEHWVILGPNGSGKSTMLKLIYGFLWPNVSGQIYRQGKELINLHELRKDMGWVANDLVKRIPNHETVLHTVMSGRYGMFGYFEDYISEMDTHCEADALELMEKLGIIRFKERKTQTLSQGERQKVLLARALMSNPYIVMLDEALAGLDPGARENFLETLEEYMKNHDVPSFIYVTHHIEEIIDPFSHILILKEGNVLEAGHTKTRLTSETMTKLYDYPFIVNCVNNRYSLTKG